eukprot:scaffold228_cov312-Pinguiococcus_pyrenoidosus.AAC.53
MRRGRRIHGGRLSLQTDRGRYFRFPAFSLPGADSYVDAVNLARLEGARIHGLLWVVHEGDHLGCVDDEPENDPKQELMCCSPAGSRVIGLCKDRIRPAKGRMR